MKGSALGAGLVLAVLLPAAAAEAVIPSAFGPIQALLVILPQLLLALAAATLALFKPRTYRLLFAYLWSHKLLSAALAGAIAFLIWGPPLGGTKAVAEEKVGAAWDAFRGGPARAGAVAGARGPVAAPHVLWKAALGATSAVDSSAAVVGNRLYFGVSNQSAFGGGSGAIACFDADSGQIAWQYDGRADLKPALRPVFSSPAVTVEKGVAKFVVSGEGYHDDQNCRIVCLEARGKEPPALRWFVQTTSHVESAPCVFDGKVFIGAGDDGLWCVELETGKVLWRVEGAPAYELSGGEAHAGKTVVVMGTVARVNLGAKGKDDAGQLRMDVKAIREHSGAAVTGHESGRTFDRTATGRVVKEEGKVFLEVEPAFPDCESPPIGATVDGEPRVLFGSGLGGNVVVCADARTGAVLWKAPTPHPAFGAPTVAGDRLLIGVGNGNFVMSDPNPAGAVVCLSLRDGKELWKVPTGDTVIGAVAVADGRAYACCRDGHVYVVDVAKGTLAGKFPVGAPMVCSPAVTKDAVYVSSDAGKVFCLDRTQGKVQWVQTLTPGSPIFSSPSIASGRVFVGTRARGVFCIAERAAEDLSKAPPRPWTGPGGNAGRTGCADERGLPAIEGDTADLRWRLPEGLAVTVRGSLAASGRSVYVPLGDRMAQVDAASGKTVWQAPVREALAVDARRVFVWLDNGFMTLNPSNGAVLGGETAQGEVWSTGWEMHSPPRALPVPKVSAHNLVFETGRGKFGRGKLICKSDSAEAPLWSALLETPPAALPTSAGDGVFLACKGDDKAKGYLQAHRITDGSLAWRHELEDAPTSYPVANADWVVVATADDRIAVFRTDGKARDPILVGGPAVAPALWKDTLVVAGQERIAAYDLAAAEWLWNYKDQDHIGTATGQPVVSNETIWVGTTKKGLIAIGVPPKETSKK